MKICVVGAGTAGVLSILAMLNAAKREKIDLQITCIYDPSIPTIQVGESTSSVILGLITELIDFRVLRDLDEIDGTIKYGSKYKNWGAEDFFVNHIEPAIHLNSAKFSFWVLDKLKEKFTENFTIINDNVISIKNSNGNALIEGDKGSYIYDYAVDSTGFPTQEDLVSGNYADPTFTSVNSVIIYPEFKTYNENYTSSIAHRNGWMFGIPLTFRKAHGYLYNKDITSLEEAKEDFAKINPVVDVDKTRKLSWSTFYRKTIVDNKIVYSGNKLFFFEPSQGFALHYYVVFADIFVHCLSNNINVEEYLNKYYMEIVDSTQDVIALTYQADVPYQSKFWNYAKESSYQRLIKSDKFIDWCKNPSNYTHYASHSNEIMFTLINGMNIDLTKFGVKQ